MARDFHDSEGASSRSLRLLRLRLASGQSRPAPRAIDVANFRRICETLFGLLPMRIVPAAGEFDHIAVCQRSSGIPACDTLNNGSALPWIMSLGCLMIAALSVRLQFRISYRTSLYSLQKFQPCPAQVLPRTRYRPVPYTRAKCQKRLVFGVDPDLWNSCHALQIGFIVDLGLHTRRKRHERADKVWSRSRHFHCHHSAERVTGDESIAKPECPHQANNVVREIPEDAGLAVLSGVCSSDRQCSSRFWYGLIGTLLQSAGCSGSFSRVIGLVMWLG